MSSKGVPISIAVFYFRVKSDENLNNSTSRRAVVMNCVLHGFEIHFSPNNLKREACCGSDGMNLSMGQYQ